MSPIHLLPLGDANRAVVSALCSSLHEALGSPVVVREANVDLSPFFDAQRLQYNSSKIIMHLNDRLHALFESVDEDAFLLAVVSEDLCIPILTFVFGEAQLNGRVGIVSYHRLQNERYGLPGNPALLQQRLAKEALHELGHMYGLVHCYSFDCVMHISTYVEEIDTKPASFCSSCREILSGRS